jgi:hypothetical protein
MLHAPDVVLDIPSAPHLSVFEFRYNNSEKLEISEIIRAEFALRVSLALGHLSALLLDLAQRAQRIE